MKWSIKLLSLFYFIIISYFNCIASSTDSIKLCIQESKYEEALRIISQNNLSHSPSANVCYLEGVSLKNLYKIKEAVEAFQKSYQLDTTNYQNLIEIANCYKILGEYKKALFYFEKSAVKLIDNKNIQTETANMHFALENYEKANSIYKKIYIGDSSNMFIIKSIARCYDDINKEDSAIIFYKKLISMGSTDEMVYRRLINIYLKRKCYDDGIKLSENYLKVDSLNTRILRLNAYFYMLKRDYSKSYNIFTKCYLNKDTSVFVLKYLGISAFKLDSFETSKNILEQAYKLDSSDYQIPYFLGVACSSYAYKKLGIYYLNKAAKLIIPDSVYLASVFFNLGKAYDSYSNSPCKSGYDAFVKSINLNPKDSLSLLFLAFKYENCEEVKNIDMAINYYKKFIATRPVKKDSYENNPLVLSYYSVALRNLQELEKKKKK